MHIISKSNKQREYLIYKEKQKIFFYLTKNAGCLRPCDCHTKEFEFYSLRKRNLLKVFKQGGGRH